MKKILFVFLFSVLVVGAAFIIYVKSNPPLTISAYTSLKDNPTVKIIELENKGLQEIQLQQVLINDKIPEKIELVVSKSAPFEAEMEMENDPNITFYKLGQITIFPSQFIDRQGLGKQPQHYAVRMEAADMKTITVKYTYLKIPFTLKAALQTNKK
ncbi:hypothetical protein [Lysinibacillus pakistanensis]|uniref:Lipoprotein n=1 Tax=Lysinibacillus pakistanensis TaxID=759811 RepID=A0AAX3X154_9BACI|nr:hypothetical protein [Lysinibacillus pakistanensis]MDM5233466.1 hypothetical protein [Lysinibacillus pakistanensis]WHY48937.1 hypothetical protein QNH22_12160 [Lysinibacillus pakistanensis]WHY53948.1 hypothetical protein QNH24_12140 [Lysinibacillus pakistanensis]